MSERRIVLGREARVFISSLPGEFRVRLAFASHRHVVAVGRTGDEAVKNLEQSLADKIWEQRGVAYSEAQQLGIQFATDSDLASI